MAEMHTDTRRVIFKDKKQARFLLEVLGAGKMTQKDLAFLCGVSPRTVRDWLKEKSSLPIRVLPIIQKATGVKNKKADVLQIKDQYWYALKGASLGGIARFKKHGMVASDEKARLHAWRAWWKINKHKHPHIGKTKGLTLPKKSALLAEFVGIIMGDGGLTKYQCVITLNGESDYQYSLWVCKLIKKLFGIKPKVMGRKNSKALTLTVSRKLLTDFMVRLGLKTGNKLKKGLSIPHWVIRNASFSKACLRGLVDTDGCIVLERHFRNNIPYTYCKVNFVSFSPKLIKQVYVILSRLGIKAHIRRGGSSVQVEKYEDICKYMRIVGTNNPKHTQRFETAKR